MNIKPKTVDEYIDLAPAACVKKLIELRTILKETVPNASEALKWGKPVFEEKRILFSYWGTKNHISFFPTQSSLLPFIEELKNFIVAKDSFKILNSQDLPKELIIKMVKHRYNDVMENDAKWMS